MTRDRPAHQSRGHELAYADAGLRIVVGDDGETALALAHQFVDDALGCADTHEATDQEARPVGNHGHSLFTRDRLHGR